MSLISKLVPTMNAKALITAADGKITSLRVFDKGSGYKEAPAVTIFDDGGGSGAVVRAVISKGRVVDLEIVNAGVGYKSPTIRIAPSSPIPVPPSRIRYSWLNQPGAPGRQGLSRSQDFPVPVLITQDLIG